MLLATAAPAGAARVETADGGLLYSSVAGDEVRIAQTQGVDDVPRSVRFSFATGNTRPTTGPGCFFTGCARAVHGRRRAALHAGRRR